MQLQSNFLTIDTYLDRYEYIPVQDDGKCKLVQLKNLKLVRVESSGNNSYTIQEVTQGKPKERWDDIDVESAIEYIQLLEGGNDIFYKSWHVEDVLSLDSSLSREQARLVLTTAMDNHDATIGINWDVLKVYISQVLEMKFSGII